VQLGLNSAEIISGPGGKQILAEDPAGKSNRVVSARQSELTKS